MTKYNFRQASATREENQKKLDALQKDFVRLMREGGVGAIQAEPKFMMRAGQLVRQTVIDEFAMTDPTPIFTERRTGELGQTYEFEQLLNGFRVVQYAPMSHPQIFTPTKAKWTLLTKMYEQAFGIELIKVMNGQHKISDFVSMAAASLTRHYVNLTGVAINKACAAGVNDVAGRPLRTTVSGADVTKTALDNALRRMGTYNSGVTIYGSRWALDPIFDLTAGASEGLAEELMRRGVIGFYRGAKLVSVQDDYNTYKGEFTSIDGIELDNLIFIASGQPGAILMERDLSPLNWEELKPEIAYFRTGVRMDHGITVHAPWRYHVIELQP